MAWSLALCYALLHAPRPGSAQEPSGATGAEEWNDALVARVNGQPILLSHLKESAMELGVPLSGLMARGMKSEAFRRAITARVDEELLVQEAILEKIEMDEVELARRVEEQIQGLKARSGGDEGFVASLKTSQLTLDSLRRMLTRREKRRDQGVRVVARRIEIGSPELERFKRDQTAANEKYEEVLLAQILIRRPAGEASTDEAQEKLRLALLLSEELGHNPENFAQVAREKSEEPNGRTRGGLLGWIDPNRLKLPLRDRIQTMRPGEVSEPIITEEGFHVVRLLDRHTPRDLLFGQRFVEVRRELLESLRAKASIEIYPLN